MIDSSGLTPRQRLLLRSVQNAWRESRFKNPSHAISCLTLTTWSVFGHLCFTKVEGNEGKSGHYYENPLECKFVVTVISWLNNNEEKVFFQIDHTDSNANFNNSRLVYS